MQILEKHLLPSQQELVMHVLLLMFLEYYHHVIDCAILIVSRLDHTNFMPNNNIKKLCQVIFYLTRFSSSYLLIFSIDPFFIIYYQHNIILKSNTKLLAASNLNQFLITNHKAFQIIGRDCINIQLFYMNQSLCVHFQFILFFADY